MYVCVAENAELLVFLLFFAPSPWAIFFQQGGFEPPHSPTHPQTVINHKN